MSLPARRLGTGLAHLQYGALQVAATYCGLSKPHSIDGEWQHGWHPPDRNFHPEAVVGSDGLSGHRRATDTFLVARKDQEAYLNAQGYLSVHSVGLPIVYLTPPRLERLPGSLLVMPLHSWSHNTHEWDFRLYVEEIEAIRNRFTSVVACVSAPDARRGYWAKAFEEREIPVISGADFFDANSYSRMAQLFSRFDFVTTNGFGSHIAYAALYGAKPSVYGTVAPYSPRDFLRDEYYQNNPDVLERTLELLKPDVLRRRFPNLFVRPWEAATCTDWASFQLGVQCKRKPEELKSLLGWGRTTSPASSLKMLPSRFARKVRRLAAATVGSDDQAQTLFSELQKSEPGELVRTTSYWPGLETRDGPRFAWEMNQYYQGAFCQVRVNPPEGPAVDLAPGEGVSVVGLAKHHPFRKVYYLGIPGKEGQRLCENLRTFGAPLDRIAQLRSSITGMEMVAPPFPVHTKSHWQTFRDECGNVLSEASVLKMAIGESSWRDLVEALQDVPRCRLLLLECNDNPEDYLGPLLVDLSRRDFVPRLSQTRFGSFRQPGLLSRSILLLALTRSGLMIPRE